MMKWIHESRIISKDMIEKVEDFFNVKFPKDFLDIVKKYDGGYPCSDKREEDDDIIIIAAKFCENNEVINNIVSFSEEEASYIIDLFEETEGLCDKNLIPIAEDPFGNLFCYEVKENSLNIVFWDSELNEKTYICDTFSEFMNLWYEYKED